MEVNDDLVDKLAKLSRLHFSEAEKPVIKKDLERMIGFIEKLQEVDTEGVEPLLHMSPVKNIQRADEVYGQLTAEQALKNAANHDGKFFRVPKVIKK